MAHKVDPGRKYRILTLQVAVPEETPDGEVCDTFSALLSENGVDNPDSVVTDWRHFWKDAAPVVTAPKDYEEGEIFDELDKVEPLHKAVMAELPRLYRWQADSLEAFRKKFNAMSNAEALDDIDKLLALRYDTDTAYAEAGKLDLTGFDTDTSKSARENLEAAKKDIGLHEPPGTGKTNLLIPHDNPEFDGTDAAHPAWWRGEDHGILVVCHKINEALDGDEKIPKRLDIVGGDRSLIYGETLKRVKKLARTLHALATIAGYLKERAFDAS